MPKIKLTNKFISKSSCPANKQKELYYDTEIAGFILDVRRTGKKSFHYSYTQDSKRTMKKLGDADTITADQARRLALKIKKAIATDSLEDLFKPKSKAPTLSKRVSGTILKLFLVFSSKKGVRHHFETFLSFFLIFLF